MDLKDSHFLIIEEFYELQKGVYQEIGELRKELQRKEIMTVEEMKKWTKVTRTLCGLNATCIVLFITILIL